MKNPVEPPIPANLSQLSPALKEFIKLVELDSDLVAAAAQMSPSRETGSDSPLEGWLSALTEAERQEFLLKLVRREPHVDLQLINRLKELAGVGKSTPQAVPGSRRLSELQEIANTVKEQRQEQERNAAKTKQTKTLQALAPKEAPTWERVVKLIEVKQSQPYDEATTLLKDLRDLAEQQERLPEFSKRFEQLKLDYSSRPALMKRFRSIRI